MSKTTKKQAKEILKKEIEDKKPKLSEKELREILKRSYKGIIKILKYYVDLEEDDYSLITIWILGTYLHREFITYPYLFFNAMKGSGKTRVLNLIKHLSKDGSKLSSITEAVLFRTKGTLAIDEFEGIGQKGNENLRELLNVAYKKGGEVKRLRKIRGEDGENQEVEVFDVYRPIVMANIWGIEEVLGDRCIEIILEKSNRPIITKKVENFDDNVHIMDIVTSLSLSDGQCGHLGQVFRTHQKGWNDFIEKSYNPINKATMSTLSTSSTKSTMSTLSLLYNKINKTELEGRDLELFLPLYLISNLCGVLDKMIKISIRITKGKKEKDMYEGKDIQLYDFISQFEETDYIRVRDLTLRFKSFVGSEEKDKWPNTWWLGQALKRLKLIRERKRSNGTLVILDIEKAKEKIKMFKEPEEPGEKQDKIEVVKIK